MTDHLEHFICPFLLSRVPTNSFQIGHRKIQDFFQTFSRPERQNSWPNFILPCWFFFVTNNKLEANCLNDRYFYGAISRHGIWKLRKILKIEKKPKDFWTLIKTPPYNTLIVTKVCLKCLILVRFSIFKISQKADNFLSSFLHSNFYSGTLKNPEIREKPEESHAWFFNNKFWVQSWGCMLYIGDCYKQECMDISTKNIVTVL